MQPKVIENGITVPPGLQMTSFTLKFHQSITPKHQKLTREEALRIGYTEAEVDAYFQYMKEFGHA